MTVEKDFSCTGFVGGSDGEEIRLDGDPKYFEPAPDKSKKKITPKKASKPGKVLTPLVSTEAPGL